jgi:hypothetical protein
VREAVAEAERELRPELRAASWNHVEESHHPVDWVGKERVEAVSGRIPLAEEVAHGLILC